MQEIITKSTKYNNLLKEKNLINKTICKLNTKILKTKNYEKRYDMLNQVNAGTDKIIKINSIIDYINKKREIDNLDPNKINDLINLLLTNDEAYRKAMNIDRRRKKQDFEF